MDLDRVGEGSVVFTAERRRSVLATFPPGVPVNVIASARAEFAPLVAERNDPVTRLYDLHAVVAGDALIDASAENILIEGLDDLDEPEAFLNALRAAMPQARVFALVANGAHVLALGAFYAGTPLAGARPLLREDIDVLFAPAAWNVLAVKPLPDETLPPPETLPFHADFGAIVVTITNAEMFARTRDAGFLVIADPA